MTDGQPSDLRSLGEILRAAREAQGRGLEQLSTATRISAAMLEALETDQLDKLGTPVYAKGFVRTLAKELRLNERTLVLKLEAQLAAGRGAEAGGAVRGATWRYDQVKVVRPVAPKERRLPPWKLLVALLVVALAVLGGIWLGRRGTGHPSARAVPSAEETRTSGAAPAARTDTPAQPTTPTTSQPGTQNAAAPPPAATQGPATSLSANGSGDAGLASLGVLPAPVPTPAAPVPSPPVNPLASSSAAPPQEVVVLPQRGGLASIERSGAEPAPARLHFLDLRARGHVEIFAGIDGAQPLRRVLDAGQSWKLSAREFFKLRLSDAAACEVWMDGAQQRTSASGAEFRLPPETTP